MSITLLCYRCGAGLDKLSLPLSRRDQCPDCSADLHVCAMCKHFDPGVPRQCREDGAEEVKEKERANFCDWFSPSETAFDPSRRDAAAKARSQLDALFGGAEPAADEQATSAADDLFK